MRGLESRVSRLEKRLLKRAASEEVSFCLLYRGPEPSKKQLIEFLGEGARRGPYTTENKRNYLVGKYGEGGCLRRYSLLDFQKFLKAPIVDSWDDGFIVIVKGGEWFLFYDEAEMTEEGKFRLILENTKGNHEDVAVDAMWYLFFGDRDKSSNSYVRLRSNEEDLSISLNQYFFDREFPIVNALSAYDIEFIGDVLDEASGIVKEFYEEREAEDDFDPNPDFDEDGEY